MTGRKIKIALCLSGEPRSSMFTFPYIYENFINIDPSLFQVDTYSYSFTGFRSLPLYNCKEYVIDNRNEGELFQAFIDPLDQKFTPQVLDTIVTTPNYVGNNQNGIKNLFLMWFNIQNCFNLVQDKYDIYVRLRHDIIFKNKVYFTELCSQILDKKTDLIISKEHEFKEGDNVCTDYLAIGNYKSMSYYSAMSNSLLKLINHYNSFKSETLLFNYLKNNKNINFSKTFIEHYLVRRSFANTTPSMKNFSDE